jgi:hypothetical protein
LRDPDFRSSTTADIRQRGGHVRKVPLSDSCAAATVPLFDHLVGEVEQLWRYVKAERLRSLAIDHRLVLGGACIGRSERVLVLEDAVDVTSRLPEQVNWIGPLADQAPPVM